MQLNSTPMRVVRNVKLIGACIGLSVAGLLFVGLGIYFLANPTPNESGEVDNTFAFIAIILGGVAILASVFSFLRYRKNRAHAKPLTEEEVAANEKRLHEGEPELPNLKDTKLFFHYCGTLNQSYSVQDKDGRTVYSCKLRKFNPLGASTFEFTDGASGFTKSVKIGKTITGGDEHMDLTSHFTIDGVECWDYLHQRGYQLKQYVLQRPYCRYELVKLGKVVATLVPAHIKDPWNENARNILMMPQGCYRIEIADCRLDDAVMAAFIAAKVNVVE